MKTIKEFNEIEQLKIKKVMLVNDILNELTDTTLIEMNGTNIIKIVNDKEYLFENNKIQTLKKRVN